MSSVLVEENAGPVELPMSKVVGRRLRWTVVRKLAEGSCGAVYMVQEDSSRVRAAMKAESNFVAGGGVLKLEVQVLKRLQGRKIFPQLLDSGKNDHYSYMVMTLCGASLWELFEACGQEFSVSTQLRVGLQILYGLKQLHEVGFVHRDLKPANLAIGRKGERARMVHLLDFGLAREFVLRRSGRVELRKPRPSILFRGTTKYCSENTHTRAEQGRPDDLWSMMYVLAEMRGPLPWDQLLEEHEIAAAKAATGDERLFQRSPPALRRMAAHLRTLDYAKRPDYALLFDLLLKAMLENNVKYSDPFDWELRGVSTTAGKTKAAGRKASVMTVSEDKSVDVKTMETSTENRQQTTAEEAPTNGDLPPFTAADLAKNELGF